MQFKHPEILYFLFLLVIPILVHLFQLRKFKKEYFTNVKILKELSIQTRKSSKLKKYLLLASRLLLLAAAIFAFAQPFFAAKDSKNANNELYLVLDNSYSMQAKGQKGELLKRAVEELLEHTPENVEFSLVTNSENFWKTDIKSVQKELQNIKYSASAFNLEKSLSQINSKKSAFNKDIIVITDAVGLEANQLKSINENDNTLFVVPKAEQKNNVAIDSVFINQNLDNFYEISVQLTSYGKIEAEIPVALYNGKKLVAKTIAKLKEKKTIQNFTIPKADFDGYVSISDNALSYDNDYYFSITKPKKLNVISIGETEKSNFLSRIYTDSEFEYQNFPLANLDYNKLDKQDAIVLNELTDVPQALQTTLKSFVEKGGNLIIIPSISNSIQSLNKLTNLFGIQYNTTLNSEKLITQINYNNPIFSSVFEKKVSNFQYPKTNQSYSFSSSLPAVLAYQDQTPFLAMKQNKLSAIYLFAAPINKDNSNFQNSPLIVPAFYNMAQNSQKSGVVALTIGENNPFVVDANLMKDEIVELRNNNSENASKFIPNQQIINNKVKLLFNEYPEVSGNYGVFNKDKNIQNIGFNYSRTESNIDQSNESILSDYKVSDSVETTFDTLKFNRTEDSIWKWFVILALLFLVSELLIQKFVK